MGFYGRFVNSRMNCMNRSPGDRRLIFMVKLFLLLLITINVISGCTLQQPTHRTSYNRLYTSSDIDQIAKYLPSKSKDKNVYFDKFLPFGKPVSALEAQIATALNGYEKDTPLVLYVHGRGNNMEKTVKKNIVGNLEKNFGVAVVQFHWQSQNLNGWKSYPIKQVVDSAANLVMILKQLEKIRTASNSILNGRKVHMLVHSMGNLMLREIGSVPLIHPEKVIDNLILNARMFR